MASEPRSLNDLPNEILLKLLSHFGPEDLSLTIAKVCKRLNILAKDVLLWKTLSYHCDGSSDINRIVQVLTGATALQSLIVRKREDASQILQLLFHKLVDLRKLSLEHCWLGEDSTVLLANIVELYPNLDSLSLTECWPLTSAGYDLIPNLKKLCELHVTVRQALNCCIIDRQQEISRKTIRLIADNCQHLEKLSLGGVRHIDDDDVIHVIKKLGKQLTALLLDGNFLTDVAFSYLNNCSRLQELKLLNCDGMSDKGLLEGIGSLHGLTSLRLHLCRNLTAQALSSFLHRPSMASIVLLQLSFCYNLDDEGLKGIAKRCIHLKELTIYFCDNVTDAGISMVISHCNQLRVLRLIRLKNITGEEWLVLVPSHLKHLTELDLRSCKIGDKYVKELKAAPPKLEIKW